MGGNEIKSNRIESKQTLPENGKNQYNALYTITQSVLGRVFPIISTVDVTFRRESRTIGNEGEHGIELNNRGFKESPKC